MGALNEREGITSLTGGKKNIFYKLPYWSSIELKHNLDVMHVEKGM